MLRHVCLFWGSGVGIPWAIEGVFKFTSAVHDLLLFSVAFSFSADLGFFASNGDQEVQDVFTSPLGVLR